MTCEQAELRMGELLAAEISPAGRSELEQHLLDCADCREDFRLAREGYRLSWAEVPVPHDVIQGTLAALREPPALVRVFRWGTAAAAIISVAVLLISSSRSTPVVPPPAEPGAAACTLPQETVLATMQDAVVGALVCKDEDGRPVGELGLKSHEVSVEILDGIAKTTVEENFENQTDRRLEGSFNFPLPSDASISRLALEVNGKIEEGTCLERERARQVFESIVRKMQDPALLEWQPGGFFKCRVFPIEPRATKRVIVAYTQTLPCFQGKMSYVYPLASEKTRTHPPGEVRIHVTARFTGALTRIESTSHHLDVQRKDEHEASMSFRAANYRPNNDFVVTLEPQEEEVRVVCHKPDAEPGYFACFATPKSTEPRAPEKHTFVLDASASISAPRLEVAKRLVRAMMERAIPGDRFEVLAHSVEVESSGEVDLRAANTFMDRLQPIGGSDVLKALKAAGPGEIVYIGKGTPTFGETRTAAILEAMKGARIRTVAVGSDANLPLLEKLGGMMRIAPNDEVDKRVGEIAATLGSPVISELKVEGENISDVVGVRDLFAGERLIVVGRYKAAGASKVVLSGRGYRREVEVAFPEKEEANNPARRLWAQRKVADLLAKGESTKPEVTALGVKYQIMTPYTSFLVLESEQMWKDHQLQREVQKQDKVLGRGEEGRKRMAEAEASSHEIETTRVMTRKMAELLLSVYTSYEEHSFDKAIKGCDEILTLDPHYSVAIELKAQAERARHRDNTVAAFVPTLREWRGRTEGGEQPVIPESETVRFMSREEWTEMCRRNGYPPLPSIADIELKVAVTRKVAHLLELAYMAAEQKSYDRTIKLCDEILSIDPTYPVAKSLRDEMEKSRHKEQYFSILSDKLETLKRQTDDDDQPKIPEQAALKIPSREHWGEISKRLNERVIRTEAGPAAGEPPRDDFRVRLEMAQIEVTKHVRDGERYLNARMYEQAQREFENAEFKILNIPGNVRAMNELLPGLKDSIIETRNAQILEERRTGEEKRRMSEAEAAARPRAKIVEPPSGRVGPGFSSQETARLEPETRVVQPRYVTPPAVYTAKVEPGKTLNGQPMSTPEAEEVYRNWALRRQLEAQLSRDANGKVLGSLNYDPMTNVFVVRDRPEVQERIRTIVETADAAAGPQAQDESRQQLLQLREGGLTRPGLSITDAAGITVDELEFPNLHEAWKDLISKRRVREGGTTFGEDPDSLAIHRKLDTMKVDLAFENTKLEDILGFVRDFSGLNLILDAEVRDRVDPDKTVTFKVRDLSVGQTLNQLLTPLGLDYVVTDDNVVLLTNKAPRELVSMRRPKGIQAMTGDTSEEDQTIKNKLQDIRMNFDMQNAPLTAVVDYIREVSGLNIHISGIENPDAEQVTLKAHDIPVDGALRLLLNSRNKDYRIRDGVVLISTQEQLRRGDALRSWRQESACTTAMEPWKADDRKILNAKVTAVAPENRSLVISVGSEDGVRVGDEFVILRGEEVIVRIWIDRVDRKSSTGSYGGVPKVGDDVTNKKLCNTSELDRQSIDSLKRIRAKMGIR